MGKLKLFAGEEAYCVVVFRSIHTVIEAYRGQNRPSFGGMKDHLLHALFCLMSLLGLSLWVL